jgi:hypothetical protein
MKAPVGIAMGAGADVACESANVVLIGNDLSKLVDTPGIARRCHRTIMQNFVGTVVVDSIGVGLAAFGFLNPLLAAFIHVSSEMAFILNSARLLPPNVFGEEIGSQIPFSFVGRRTRLEGERAKATPTPVGPLPTRFYRRGCSCKSLLTSLRRLSTRRISGSEFSVNHRANVSNGEIEKLGGCKTTPSGTNFFAEAGRNANPPRASVRAAVVWKCSTI